MSGKPPEKRTIGEQIRAWGGIPRSDAHELIEKWRKGADEYPADTDPRAKAAAAAVQLCADELEELVDS